MSCARKTTYTVTGPVAVLGHEPGTSFSADLEPKHERRLLAAGHLSIGTRRQRPARPKGAEIPRTRGGDHQQTKEGER